MLYYFFFRLVWIKVALITLVCTIILKLRFYFFFYLSLLLSKYLNFFIYTCCLSLYNVFWNVTNFQLIKNDPNSYKSNIFKTGDRSEYDRALLSKWISVFGIPVWLKTQRVVGACSYVSNKRHFTKYNLSWTECLNLVNV